MSRFCIGVAAVLLVLSFIAMAQPTRALASSDNAVEISNVRQLQAMREDLTADYVLVNDIEASETRNWNDGKGFEPIGDWEYPFLGTFDGRGYVIRGLHIDRPEQNNVGLFGDAHETAEIRSIGLVDGDVTGRTGVGSLVGQNHGSVMDSYQIGGVTGRYGVGGLVGRNFGDVTGCHGSSDATGRSSVGGLVGSNDGRVRESYATGSVRGSDGNVGGLVGHNAGDLSDSYASGDVTGSAGVGGLVGFNLGAVRESYATGSVRGSDGGVGGLVGGNYDGVVSGSYAMGDVTGANAVGGLVGQNLQGGVVSGSYAMGDVTGVSEVGGLVGSSGQSQIRRSFVRFSYATGRVTGVERVGGLVGYDHNGSIDDSYATGDVSGEKSVGGVTGYSNNDANINRTYSIGKVVGDMYVGGLVGWNLGVVGASFWDVETSGTEQSAAGIGRTTEEMKDINTFLDAGWGIGFTLDANPTDGYPFLSWQQGNAPSWLMYGEPVRYSLTIDVIGEGTTTPARGTHTFVEGEAVTIVASPAGSHGFIHWSGDVDTVADVYAAETTITADSDYDIVATFVVERVAPPEPVNWFIIGGIVAAVVAGVLSLLLLRRRKA